MRLYSIKTTLARFVLTVYIIVLTYLSVRPVGGDGRGAAIAWGLHLLAYLGLGVLVAFSFPERFQQHRIRSVTEVALVGLGFELIQLVVPTRTFSLIDIGMNTVGAGLSWFSPVLYDTLFSGSGDEEDRGTPEEQDITAGDLEGQTPQPQDMRMIGDREQDRQP